MNRVRSLFVLIVLIALAAALAACGSGGGSDDPQSVVLCASTYSAQIEPSGATETVGQLNVLSFES